MKCINRTLRRWGAFWKLLGDRTIVWSMKYEGWILVLLVIMIVYPVDYR